MKEIRMECACIRKTNREKSAGGRKSRKNKLDIDILKICPQTAP